VPYWGIRTTLILLAVTNLLCAAVVVLGPARGETGRQPFSSSAPRPYGPVRLYVTLLTCAVRRGYLSPSRTAFDPDLPAVIPYNYSSGPYCTPALQDERAYLIGAEGVVACLRLADGTEVWRRDLYEEYGVVSATWPAAASPLLEGHRVIINLGGRRSGAGVIALDAATGKTCWTATQDGPSCATPTAATIHGKRLVFVWTAEALVALDPAEGTVYWRIPFCANDPMEMHGTSPLAIGDTVFVSGYKIGNLCVRVLPDGSYQELWRDRRELLDSQYKNLLHVDGLVCGFSATRRRLCGLELATGDLKWKWRSPINNGNLLAVDDRYLLWGAKGRLAALAIAGDGVHLLAITPRPILAPPCFPYPALHNGLLYLRNDEELLCVDLRRVAADEQVVAR
jgi:outer membrane protein assembly factor BamB